MLDTSIQQTSPGEEWCVLGHCTTVQVRLWCLARGHNRPVTDPGVLASPNIWNWPEVYERENQAVDADGALWAALADQIDWSGADVADVGCGDGFHLPQFAQAGSQRSRRGATPSAGDSRPPTGW